MTSQNTEIYYITATALTDMSFSPILLMPLFESTLHRFIIKGIRIWKWKQDLVTCNGIDYTLRDEAES